MGIPEHYKYAFIVEVTFIINETKYIENKSTRHLNVLITDHE